MVKFEKALLNKNIFTILGEGWIPRLRIKKIPKTLSLGSIANRKDPRRREFQLFSFLIAKKGRELVPILVVLSDLYASSLVFS